MASYDTEKLVKLAALKALAEKVKSDYATKTEVSQSIKTAIAETGHASFKKVEQLPEPEAAEENVLYLFKNAETQKYDIYAKVDGSDQLERLDDTTVDLADYVTTEKLTQELAKKAESTHNHTTSEITDLQDALDAKQDKGDYATKTELTSGLAGKAEKEHDHEDATDSKHGYMSIDDKKKLDGIEIATNEDVEAMLTEVFDAA